MKIFKDLFGRMCKKDTAPIEEELSRKVVSFADFKLRKEEKRLAQERDELYEDALEFAASMEEISISMLQRHFKIGYNRAAKIMKDMERDGFID